MKRFVAGTCVTPTRSGLALGIVLAAILALAGCNDYGNTFQNPTGASLSSVAPSNISAGGPDFTLTLNGSGFVAKTVVQWNQKTDGVATHIQTDSAGNVTGLTATVTAALIAKPGTAFVNTLNPASGAGNNGLSNSIAFIVNPAPNPLPTLTSISPNSAVAGSAAFTLTLTGSSFLPTSDPSGGSQVNWITGATQTTLPIVTISSTQIQATVSASLIAGTGSATVTAYNPPSPQTTPTGGVPNPSPGGGGTSVNGPTFTITAKPASAVTAQNAMEETPAVSVDGRYVAYSAAQNEHAQVFVRDTCEGAAAGCQPHTFLLSAAADGAAGNDDSRSPSMSSDGRYIAFSSAASNLAPGAPAGRQIYLRDTCFGAASGSCAPSTQLVSTDTSGALVGTESILPSVSASGRFVAFLAVTPSHAANHAAGQAKSAAAGANSGYRQVFVRDTCLGAAACTPKTTRISLQPGDASTEAKPAGPALTGTAGHLALAGANAPTLFTRAVAVDDRVFLALIGNKP